MIKCFQALWNRLLRPQGGGISILIPFRSTDTHGERFQNLEWLLKYWKVQLPGAEIIIGKDPALDKPFSKSVAVNEAASHAHGDIFVIIDADGYLLAEQVLHCAAEIRNAQKRGRKLWFVPYRRFYRLTQKATKLLCQSDPANPYEFSSPPEYKLLVDNDWEASKYKKKHGRDAEEAWRLKHDRHYGDAPNVGHWYGAMIQILSREAFEIVGGWDERFRGWGGEDYAAMRAVDTLYAMHKTLPSQVLHLWHPQLGSGGTQNWVHWTDRRWENQDASQSNGRLTTRYSKAVNDPQKMRALLDESRKK